MTDIDFTDAKNDEMLTRKRNFLISSLLESLDDDDRELVLSAMERHGVATEIDSSLEWVQISTGGIPLAVVPSEAFFDPSDLSLLETEIRVDVPPDISELL